MSCSSSWRSRSDSLRTISSTELRSSLSLPPSASASLRVEIQRPARRGEWRRGVWYPHAANERSEPIRHAPIRGPLGPLAGDVGFRNVPRERDLGLRFDKSRRARSRRWPQFGRAAVEQLRRHVDRRAFEAGPVVRRHLHDAGLVGCPWRRAPSSLKSVSLATTAASFSFSFSLMP
jgi:hypothetical protein